MGLIKTAIMTGGGMYAANKIAKTIQQQNSTNGQNNSRDNPYPQQDNYHPRPAPLQGPRATRDESYGEIPADRDLRDYYAYDNGSRREYDPNRDYSARTGMKPAKSSGFTFPVGEDDIYSGRYIQSADYPYQPASSMAQRSDDPPTYSPHPQYVQSRPYVAQQGQQRQRYDEQQQISGGHSSLGDMAAGMTMDFVRNGGKEGKKDKGKKGRDMISELLK